MSFCDPRCVIRHRIGGSGRLLRDGFACDSSRDEDG